MSTGHLWLTDIDYGHWCDTCALPSAKQLHWLLEVDDRPEHASTLIVCPDCEGCRHG